MLSLSHCKDSCASNPQLVGQVDNTSTMENLFFYLVGKSLLLLFSILNILYVIYRDSCASAVPSSVASISHTLMG